MVYKYDSLERVEKETVKKFFLNNTVKPNGIYVLLSYEVKPTPYYFSKFLIMGVELRRFWLSFFGILFFTQSKSMRTT